MSEAADGRDGSALDFLRLFRFEQAGDIYDVPVTIAVTYTDNKTSEFVVIVNEAANEARFPLGGTIRSIEANPDGAAIALLDRFIDRK